MLGDKLRHRSWCLGKYIITSSVSEGEKMPRCVTLADFNLGINSSTILISGCRQEVDEWELGRDVHCWLS